MSSTASPLAAPSKPFWQADKIPRRQTLSRDLTVDVCIVGGGVAGMLTAWRLTQTGRTVAVLDHRNIASGETGHTSAHLANAIDDRYYEMIRLHGEEGARIAAESHSTAIGLYEEISRKEKIACDFERLDGYLFQAAEDTTDHLDDELKAAHTAGLKDVELLSRSPVPSLGQGRCLRFPRQGQIHPVKLLAGLAGAIERDGGKIFGGTRVKSVEGGENTARIETAGGPVVTAKAVIVATNSPINDMFVIHTKQAPYTTFAIGVRIQKGKVPRALYWDTLDAYHYVRLQSIDDSPEDELLIVGGEDHKTAQAQDHDERYARLAEWTRQQFAVSGPVEWRWNGQVMETVDGLAYIGRNPRDKDNVFVVTGDSGMGMTHGAIAALLLPDLIEGKTHPWAELYDPSRMRAGALADFALENINVVEQYADWITPGEISDPTELTPGAGAIMRRGLSKIAVYRDENGAVHQCSAVCPHLQCIVAWNPSGRIWDCPCHGSRFSPTGEVLNGPSNTNLPPVEKS